ncbi:MAG TPA: hypothetical protein VFJ28_01295, partial [Marmoricola sp.]|nr:hypothetical protein [Marmoricola sp.]
TDTHAGTPTEQHGGVPTDQPPHTATQGTTPAGQHQGQHGGQHGGVDSETGEQHTWSGEPGRQDGTTDAPTTTEEPGRHQR